MNDPLPKAEGGADISLGGAQGGVRERWKSNAKRHESIMVRPEGRSPKLMATSGGLSPLMTSGEARGPVTK